MKLALIPTLLLSVAAGVMTEAERKQEYVNQAERQYGVAISAPEEKLEALADPSVIWMSKEPFTAKYGEKELQGVFVSDQVAYVVRNDEGLIVLEALPAPRKGSSQTICSLPVRKPGSGLPPKVKAEVSRVICNVMDEKMDVSGYVTEISPVAGSDVTVVYEVPEDRTAFYFSGLIRDEEKYPALQEEYVSKYKLMTRVFLIKKDYPVFSFALLTEDSSQVEGLLKRVEEMLHY